MDAQRRLGRRHVERLRHLGVDRLDCLGGFEPQPAAGKEVRIEIAQHDRGVCHRRVLSAAPVAGGAGLGAGRVRADAQSTRGVEMGDAAAARAERGHIDHAYAHGISAYHALGAQHRLAPADQRDVGRSAADIDRYQVVGSRRCADDLPADHPGGRTGQEQPDRPLAGDLGDGEPAARLHDLQWCIDAGLGEAFPEACQIGIDAGLQVGIEGGDDGALVLAEAPDRPRGRATAPARDGACV